METRPGERLSETAQYRLSEWLSSEDLKGQNVEGFDAEISDLEIHENADMGEGRKVSGASISFKGVKRKMWLNTTNRKSLQRIHGDERDHLIGKRVHIYVDHKVRGLKGKIVDGLRIKEAIK